MGGCASTAPEASSRPTPATTVRGWTGEQPRCHTTNLSLSLSLYLSLSLPLSSISLSLSYATSFQYTCRSIPFWQGRSLYNRIVLLTVEIGLVVHSTVPGAFSRPTPAPTVRYEGRERTRESPGLFSLPQIQHTSTIRLLNHLRSQRRCCGAGGCASTALGGFSRPTPAATVRFRKLRGSDLLAKRDPRTRTRLL